MANDKTRGRTDSAKKHVAASAEELYAAFSDGETLMGWLPPANMTGRAFEYHFRQGGRYRIELRYREGVKGAGKTTGDSDISTGVFIELVPGRKIRQTVEFESENEALTRGMTMTWTFEPRQKVTEVTVTAEDVPPAIGEEDHVEGLTASLNNLARFVERAR